MNIDEINSAKPQDLKLARRNEDDIDLNQSQKSIDNPMLWDEQNPKLNDEEDVDAILKNWEDRDMNNANKHNIKGLEKSEENILDDFEPDFITPRRLGVRDSPIRRSTYVRRSIDMRLRESRWSNPIESFQNNEDFRYYLRSDTQVLFSLLDIDSKNLELTDKDQLIEENVESDYDSEAGDKLKLELFKDWSKFIRHKLKNHKEKRKHRQLLRINNKENDEASSNPKKANNPFDFQEYTGVNFKNYLRGVKLDLKISQSAYMQALSKM